MEKMPEMRKIIMISKNTWLILPIRPKDLVRFYYPDRESMFDMVSYSKGGRILNMLRNYVGDSAFFKALNIYLKPLNSKMRKHITCAWHLNR